MTLGLGSPQGAVGTPAVTLSAPHGSCEQPGHSYSLAAAGSGGSLQGPQGQSESQERVASTASVQGHLADSPYSSCKSRRWVSVRPASTGRGTTRGAHGFSEILKRTPWGSFSGRESNPTLACLGVIRMPSLCLLSRGSSAQPAQPQSPASSDTTSLARGPILCNVGGAGRPCPHPGSRPVPLRGPHVTERQHREPGG